jgi:cytochrome c peroxidase
MKRTLAYALAVVAFGCGGKKDKPTEGSSAPSGGSSTEPVAQRPSELPQTPLEKLALPDDPKRAEKIALGNALFFDKRLSGHNDRACYTCHQNEDGTGGHDPLAIGSGDKPQKRHAPTLWNVGYWKGAFYWDGRAKTLEANIKGAWAAGNMAGAPPDTKPEEQMGFLDKKVDELAKVAGYKKLFDAAYPGAAPKGEQAIGAIAEYMRTMVCNDTVWDKFAAGDKKAMTEQQLRGYDIFMTPSLGNCVRCHAPPYFSVAMATDGGTFFNVGIGTEGKDEKDVDPGRKSVTKDDKDWAKFKIPSLRNITKSAPYFHDGSRAKIEDAVRTMAGGGIANKNKDPDLNDRKLNDLQIRDLIAFLGALECPNKLEEPKAMP